jgi:hypothetical protein
MPRGYARFVDEGRVVGTMASILIGTSDGIYELEKPAGLEGRTVSALGAEGPRLWALADGTSLLRSVDGGGWESVAEVEGHRGRCVLPLEGADGLVGTSEARLMRLRGSRLEPVPSFDRVEGRDRWYTPWGGPPDTRSLTRATNGRIFANVHVGGIVRSDDAETWEPAGISVDSDVHQVLAHPSRANVVLAACAYGLAVSDDGGDTWTFETDGLHASYCRAVAVSAETVLVSASRGHRGEQAAVYRLTGNRREFERCSDGLPEWFDDNVDTHCLAAQDGTVALGTTDGSVYVSTDEGATWEQAGANLPSIRCLVIV